MSNFKYPISNAKNARRRMQNQVTVSAPGKLMLLGEHAVVYGYPCIVTAMGQRIRLTIEELGIKNYELRIDAEDVGVENYVMEIGEIGKVGGKPKKEVAFIETAVKNWRDKFGLENGIAIETRSEFSAKFGFGSSSAVTVCVMKALSELFDKNISNKTLFDLCYKTVLDVQGKGSGFDLAAAIYGKTVFFQNYELGIKNYGKNGIDVVSLYSNDTYHYIGNQLSLVVGYTGVKADTVTIVKQVEKSRESSEGRKREIDKIFEEIGKIVAKGKIAIEKGDFGELGKLMNMNQGCLESLGVSTDKLDSLISAARNAGAFGAKLSGAGGGDCMIAVVSDEKKDAVEKAIANAGGVVLHVKPNAEGIRVEK